MAVHFLTKLIQLYQKQQKKNETISDIDQQTEDDDLLVERKHKGSEQSGIEFLMSIAGMFDSGKTDTSENVEVIVTDFIKKAR